MADPTDETAPREDEAGSGGRLEESLSARLQKLERLRAAGIEPFALLFEGPLAAIADVREQFADLAVGADTDTRVRVAGRIGLLRKQGNLSLASLPDPTGAL